MSKDRLSALAMLIMQKVMIENIINFDDKFIDKFAFCKESRMDFCTIKMVNEVISY
jgi:hypothetical protein